MSLLELSHGRTAQSDIVEKFKSDLDTHRVTVTPCTADDAAAFRAVQNILTLPLRSWDRVPEVFWKKSSQSDSSFGQISAPAVQMYTQHPYSWELMWLFGEEKQALLNKNDPSAQATLTVSEWETETPWKSLSEQKLHESSGSSKDKIPLAEASTWKTLKWEAGQITLGDGSTRDGWAAIVARIAKDTTRAGALVDSAFNI